MPMHRRAERGWIGRRAGAVALLALCVAAVGADNTTLDKLWERFGDADTVIEAADARQGLDRLEQGGIKPDALEPGALKRYVLLKGRLTLATGQAAAAKTFFEQSAEKLDDDGDCALLGYAIAQCAGDAVLGAESLQRAMTAVSATRRRALRAADRRIDHIGRPAPDVEIVAESGERLNPSEPRDRVMLIDFWRVLPKPDGAHVAGLIALRNSLKRERVVSFFGVNSDSESREEAAQAFAKQAGFDWPIHYERSATAGRISGKYFDVGRPPWLVIIDHYGYIRAIGAGDEPAMHYAARCAAAEARGDAPAVVPRDVNGKQPARAAASITEGAVGAAAAKPDRKPAELRDDQEAENLMKQARLYLKTGRRTDAKKILERVIREYPDTQQARDAKAFLSGL